LKKIVLPLSKGNSNSTCHYTERDVFCDSQSHSRALVACFWKLFPWFEVLAAVTILNSMGFTPCRSVNTYRRFDRA